MTRHAAAFATGILQPGPGGAAPNQIGAPNPRQQAAAASTFSPRGGGPALPLEPQPEWLKPMLKWWQAPGEGGGGAAATVSSRELASGLQALSKALGEQVAVAGMPGSPQQGALLLRATSRCEGGESGR